MGEGTDRAALARDLNAALPLQARDALAATIAAGTLAGPEGIALTDALRRIAADDLRDLERTAARIATLGGTPSVSAAEVELPEAFRAGVEQLLGWQRETLDALVDAIPADADDAEGEASEHLLEHVIARKRDAIELLERVLR